MTRQPPGIPAGGQFATSSRPEAATPLTPEHRQARQSLVDEEKRCHAELSRVVNEAAQHRNHATDTGDSDSDYDQIAQARALWKIAEDDLAVFDYPEPGPPPLDVSTLQPGDEVWTKKPPLRSLTVSDKVTDDTGRVLASYMYRRSDSAGHVTRERIEVALAPEALCATSVDAENFRTLMARHARIEQYKKDASGQR